MKKTIEKVRLTQLVQVIGYIFNFAIAELAMTVSKTPLRSYLSLRLLVGFVVVNVAAFAVIALKDMQTNMFAISVFTLMLSIITGISTLIIHYIQVLLGYGEFDFVSIIIFTAIIFVGLLVINTVICKILNSIKFNVLFVHSSTCNQRFINKLKTDVRSADKIADFVIDELTDETINSFKDEIQNYDKIVFLDELDNEFIYKLSYPAIDSGKIVKTMPEIHALLYMSGELANIGDTPFISVRARTALKVERVIKRVFDFVCSAFMIILLSPIFIGCAIAIKLEDHGPVFYKQERYTYLKKKFYVYKFRSMRTDAEKFGAMYAQENDPRITKVGRVIRALRIDELPQLINILKGEMSFVGPRPERPVFADEYSEIVKDYDLRFLMKAGLTGYAQVCGKYNTHIEDKQLYDVIYVSKFTLLLDIEILLKTVLVVFTKEATAGYENGTEITQTAKDNAKKQEAINHE